MPYHRTAPFLCASLIGFSLVSCRTINTNKGSETKTLLFAHDFAGLTKYVTKKELEVCLTTSQQNNEATLKRKIETAISTWIGYLRPLSKQALTTKIIFVPTEKCQAAQLQVVAQTQIKRSYTNTGMPVITTTLNSEDPLLDAVVMHEIGHTFGLNDTYNLETGLSGDCIPNQPKEAIMCDTRFKVPQKDDIIGVRTVFAIAHPDLLSDTAQERLRAAQPPAEEREDIAREIKATQEEIDQQTRVMQSEGFTILEVVNSTSVPSIDGELGKALKQVQAAINKLMACYGVDTTSTQGGIAAPICYVPVGEKPQSACKEAQDELADAQKNVSFFTAQKEFLMPQSKKDEMAAHNAKITESRQRIDQLRKDYGKWLVKFQEPYKTAFEDLP